jgi:hypothetical protein
MFVDNKLLLSEMVASPIEQVQIDPVVALQIAKCFNDERAQDEDRIVRDFRRSWNFNFFRVN